MYLGAWLLRFPAGISLFYRHSSSTSKASTGVQRNPTQSSSPGASAAGQRRWRGAIPRGHSQVPVHGSLRRAGTDTSCGNPRASCPAQHPPAEAPCLQWAAAPLVPCKSWTVNSAFNKRLGRYSLPALHPPSLCTLSHDARAALEPARRLVQSPPARVLLPRPTYRGVLQYRTGTLCNAARPCC